MNGSRLRKGNIDILLSVLSGLMLVAAFPRPGWSFLPWACLLPLLFAIEGKRPGRAFGLGYLMGAVYNFGSLYWLCHVTIAGWIVLSAYISIYPAIFAVIFNRLKRCRPVPLIVSAPCAWVGLELLRSRLITGFPWGVAGTTQYTATHLIQICEFTGVYGISFLIVMVNVALYGFLCGIRARRGFLVTIAPLIAATAVVLAVLLYGKRVLSSPPGPEPSLKITLVQGNIEQHFKWDPAEKPVIMGQYRRLSMAALRDGPDILIWPETALPGYLQYDPELQGLVADVIDEGRCHFIVGSTHAESVEGQDIYYNSAFFISPEKNVTDRYDKIHLVIFGEYVPFRNILFFIASMVPFEQDFSFGQDYKVVTVKGAPVGVLICFEDAFPDVARRFVKNGARLLINITNDAWFWRSCEPYQHLAMGTFRTVENRVPMVRCANTGVSCFIDRYGREYARLKGPGGYDIFVEGHLTATARPGGGGTFYAEHGDVFSMACLVLSTGAFLFTFLKKERRIGGKSAKLYS